MKRKKLLPTVCYNSKSFLKHNSSTILTCIGAIGVVTTTVIGVKTTPKAIKLLDDAKKEKGEELTKIEAVIVAGPVYIPTIIIGLSTIACIFGANVLNKHQQAAITSAYALLDNSFKEYKNKVKELYGEDSNRIVRGAIAKDKYNQNEIEISEDKQLFYDEYSGRYFESTFEDVMCAEYHFNRNFTLRGYSYLNEFYEFLGIDTIEEGDVVGWSLYKGETTYGYQWVDFDHEQVVLDGDLECYLITMPFQPTIDFMDE